MSSSCKLVLRQCPRFTAHRLDAMEASPVPFESSLFLYSDKAADQLVRLIWDTNMGTRRDRLQREALRNGEVEGPGQFGEERPEDGLGEEEEEGEGEEEWERERDDERGEEEGIDGEGEAGDAAVKRTGM
jgi:hypothetical protein